MAEQRSVLGGERLCPAAQHRLERLSKVFLEQALATAGDFGMPVEYLLHPGGAGARRAADEEQLAPPQLPDVRLMFDPTGQQMCPINTGMRLPVRSSLSFVSILMLLHQARSCK